MTQYHGKINYKNYYKCTFTLTLSIIADSFYYAIQLYSNISKIYSTCDK